jgi:hypothetical protein
MAIANRVRGKESVAASFTAHAIPSTDGLPSSRTRPMAIGSAIHWKICAPARGAFIICKM